MLANTVEEVEGFAARHQVVFTDDVEPVHWRQALEDLAVVSGSQAQPAARESRFHVVWISGSNPKSVQGLEAIQAVVSVRGMPALLADGTARLLALLRGQQLEAVTLAGCLALAGVFGGLAIVLPGATGYAVAVNFCVGGGFSLDAGGRCQIEQAGCCQREGGTLGVEHGFHF